MTDDANQNTDIEPDYLQQLKEQNERSQLLLERNKKALFDAIKPTGVAKISVEFDGSGNDGQIQSISASIEGEDGEATVPDVLIIYETFNWPSDGSQHPKIPAESAIQNLCYDLLDQDHCGWGNDAGAFGTFIFDVAASTINLAFNERFEDYSTTKSTY